jgi:PII-like signaling protein
VFIGEADKWHDETLYEAAVKKLGMMDIARATVYRGILGYGAKGASTQEDVFSTYPVTCPSWWRS